MYFFIILICLLYFQKICKFFILKKFSKKIFLEIKNMINKMSFLLFKINKIFTVAF